MQHIHKFRRVNKARKGNPEYWVMACALPNCTTYFPMKTKRSAPDLIGKQSLCNGCGAIFELTKYSMQVAKPQCDSCIEPKEKKKKGLDSAMKFFDDLTKDTVLP